MKSNQEMPERPSHCNEAEVVEVETALSERIIKENKFKILDMMSQQLRNN